MARIRGTSGNDTLTGTAGSDTIDGLGGDDILYGLEGSDTLRGNAGDDTLDGGDDNDVLTGAAGNDTLLGASGADELNGGADDDWLDGGTGNDSLAGASGSDTLLGGSGDDELHGGSDNDWLDGGDDNDSLTGAAGDDTLLGGGGNDELNGGAGNDLLDGGAGNDILHGSGGTDTLLGGSGDDHLTGGADNDQLHGGDDNDTLTGAGGGDILLGEGGNDSLDGGSGDDTLAGGAGSDTLRGGSGDDTYVFASGDGLDTLADIKTGAGSDDRIDVSGVTGIFSLADIQARAVQNAGNLEIDFGGGDVLRLLNKTLGNLHADDFIFNTTPPNSDPVAGADAASLGEDTVAPVTGNVLANDTDADAGAVLSVAAPGTYTGTYGTLTLNADGSYSYQRDADLNGLAVGQSVNDIFSYTVSDEHGGTDSADLNITISGSNDGPLATADGTDTFEDVSAPLTGNVLTNDSDPDSGAVLGVTTPGTYTGAYGTLTLNADGSYAYQRTATLDSLAVGQSVNDTFSYGASDEHGASANAALTITITGTNDGPVAAADGASLGEDDTTPATGNVLANDLDPDSGAQLSIAAPGTYSGVYGTLTLNADGSYSYQRQEDLNDLAEGQSVSDTFGYTVDDEHGASASSSLTITIAGANDAPVAQDDSAALGEDTIVPVTGNVLANDSDVDQGASLSVAAPGLYAGLYGTLTLNADGSYSYERTADLNSLGVGDSLTDSFTYALQDEHGATDAATLELTINGANDAPSAQPDSFNAVENTPFTGSVLADNGSGADSDPEGDILSVVAGTYATAQGGTVTLAADGSFTYLGAGNFAGSDSFSYTLDDGQGGSAVGSAAIEVAAAPDLTLIGTSGTDTLVGGAGSDTLQGLGGDDHLDGRAGNDRLEGGLGIDRAIYNADPGVTSGISVNLASGIVTGDLHVGTDTLRSVERVRGTDFADTYNATGFSGGSTNGGSNGFFNEFEGMGGNDTITGNGSTRITYFNATAGVVVNIGTGTATGNASVGTDTFSGVNAVRGSDGFGDTLIGAGANDTLEGQGGDDTLIGNGGSDFFRGGAGADTINGGSQSPGQGDIANYNGSAVGVSVNLLTGINTGGDAEGDILINIESLNGSSFGDTLAGDNGDNPILGFAGDDTILGNGGADVLIGGAGADVHDGGGGVDWLSYIVSDIAAGVTVNLQTGAASGGDAQGDTFTGVENLQGSQFADTLTGDGGDNQIDAQGGNDTIAGGGGNDSIFGGNGDDTIAGGTGDDWIVDESGDNTYVYATGDGVDQVLAFTFGAGNSDRIDLTGVQGVYSLADVLARSTQTQTGPNVIIDFGGGDTLQLMSVDINTLHEDDFIFAVPPQTLTGTNGSDSLTGGAGNDTLIGLGGDDNLDGRAGNDLLQGDAGTRDRAIYHVDPAITAGINVAMASGIVTGNATVGTDTLRSIERVRGTSFADSYDAAGFSGSSANAGSGGTFNEFEGAGGNDTITGNGFTQISYNAATAGVTVNMAAGTASGDSSVGSDSFSGVLTVFGSTFADTLTGSNGGETLDGNNGDDTIAAGDGDDSLRGGAGADTMDGGNGIDLVNYNDLAATTGVTVNLATGSGSGGNAAGDTYSNVENVNGSNFADTLIGNSGDNLLLGQGGDDTLASAGGTDTLVLGTGSDRVIYNTGDGADTVFDFIAGAASADVIDLTGTAGVYSLAELQARATQVGADTLIDFGNGDTLTLLAVTAANLTAEDFVFAPAPLTLTGTAGVDNLVGGAGNDTLIGLGGDDNLDGRAGNDLLQGDSGNRDRAVYDGDPAVTAGISIALASGTVTGNATVGTDTLRSIERVRGTSFADSYDATGFSGSSTNAGSNGTFNEFEGMGGNDIITGNGFTQISYFSATAGVLVNLGSGTMTGNSSVGTDTFTGVNAVRGTDGFTDTLIGSSGNDTLDGLNGNDFLRGGEGADVLIGGGHSFSGGNIQGDVAIYSTSSAGVTVNLLSGVTSGGDAQGDVLTGIESLNGSAFNDTLSGDNGQNVLQGSFGDDTLSGNGGDDWLNGGAGADSMHGGFGNDWLFYTISQTGAGVTVNLTTGIGSGGDAEGDTFFAVENVQGSQFGDTLTGNTTLNFLDGLGGNDTLAGGQGSDFLQGGAGDDLFIFATGDGADQITDFTAGAGSDDRIDLTSFSTINDLAEVQAIATDLGGVTLLDFGNGDTLTLGVNLASLHQDDFLFAG